MGRPAVPSPVIYIRYRGSSTLSLIRKYCRHCQAGGLPAISGIPESRSEAETAEGKCQQRHPSEQSPWAAIPPGSGDVLQSNRWYRSLCSLNHRLMAVIPSGSDFRIRVRVSPPATQGGTALRFGATGGLCSVPGWTSPGDGGLCASLSDDRGLCSRGLSVLIQQPLLGLGFAVQGELLDVIPNHSVAGFPDESPHGSHLGEQ